ncbi:autotransporter-associated beta strand repeat-containing protein [Variovorax sp. LARHSF232]
MGASPARAADLFVANESQLAAALNPTGGAQNGDRIILTSNITLTSDLPIIQRSVTIEGGGNTLSGNRAHRGLLIQSGTVAVNDLKIADTQAKGGAGSGGSGGGAGLGGAFFVASSANVTVTNVEIENSAATGGAGAAGLPNRNTGAGGGGGMGGDGGTSVSGAKGGNGGGGLGTGANGGHQAGAGSAGTAPGQATAGAGGGAGGAAGAAGGGGGSGSNPAAPTPAGGGGGGGGIGGAAGGAPTGSNRVPGPGGAGGFGGGGGGGGGTGATVNPAGAGGTGGFGGGGSGSAGGFGAGSGGAASTAVNGGGGGGGGAGLGGGIFVQEGGTLTLAGTLTINGSSVAAGAGGAAVDGGSGTAGSAFGSDIFLQGNGRLNFAADAGVAQTLTGSIADQAGSGGAGAYSLAKTGAGTLALLGSNTYTGGTTVTGGVVRFAAQGLGSGPVTVDGGTLQWASGNSADISAQLKPVGVGGLTLDTNANDVTLASAIGGAGAVIKQGAGVLRLAADNTYAGGTTISSGTLQLGNGGNSGSIAGDVTDNGTLAFNRADAIAFAGNITGSGSVSQAGSGTTTLTGNNLYSGGTSISAGTLIAAVSGLGSGPVDNNAALVIEQPADATMANAINGTGSLTKSGAGRLNYIGTGTLSGPTTVMAGTLAVNGSLANSAVSVASGATLAGNGIVGSTSVQNAGTVSPGNSPGTLTVAGDFHQAPGSIYRAEVIPGTATSDRIVASGSATIDSGAQLIVSRAGAGGQFALGTQYTVLSAAGGVNGTYTLSGDITSAFVQLKDHYDANNVYLHADQFKSFESVGETPNQQATGQALDVQPAGSEVAAAMAWLPDDASARQALDMLSGSIHPSVKSAAVEDSRFVRDAAIARLRAADCAPGAAGTVVQDKERSDIKAAGSGCSPAGQERAA